MEAMISTAPVTRYDLGLRELTLPSNLDRGSVPEKIRARLEYEQLTIQKIVETVTHNGTTPVAELFNHGTLRPRYEPLLTPLQLPFWTDSRIQQGIDGALKQNVLQASDDGTLIVNPINKGIAANGTISANRALSIDSRW